MKMDVKELSKNQLAELKENHFYRDYIEDDEEDDTVNYNSPHEIPDELIFEYYGATDFSNDDFCCSTERSEEEYDSRGDLAERFNDIMSIINDVASDFEHGKLSFDEALEQIKAEVSEDKE